LGLSCGKAPKIAVYRFLPHFMPKASAKPISVDATVIPIAVTTSYEDAMRELEQLVSQLESGEMPLDDMLAGYQRGALLMEHCRAKLQAVEDQIKVLDGGALKVWKSP
jgi:exodeoxyribonuclease VII small subunit